MSIKSVAYLPKAVGRTYYERKYIAQLFELLHKLEQTLCMSQSEAEKEGMEKAHAFLSSSYEKAVARVAEKLTAPEDFTKYEEAPLLTNETEEE